MTMPQPWRSCGGITAFLRWQNTKTTELMDLSIKASTSHDGSVPLILTMPDP